MRIIIRKDNDVKVNIPIPIGVIDNAIAVKLIKDNLLKNADINIKDEDLKMIIGELKRLKRELPDNFCLVDIQSKDSSINLTI